MESAIFDRRRCLARCRCRLSRIASLLLCLLGLTSSVSAQQVPRYVAVLADDSRLEADTLSRVSGRWKIDGVPLYSGQIRSLRNRQLAPSRQPPEAFVETVTGDRFPGRVTGYIGATFNSLTPLPEHFVVQPSPANGMQGSTPVGSPRPIRIRADFVRRIVWQSRRVDWSRPQTVSFRDGRSTRFRAVRFHDDQVSLLLTGSQQNARLSELSEIVLPVKNPWGHYFQELSVISPAAKSPLVQFETVAGMVATVSLERLVTEQTSGRSDFERSTIRVQPAWSLDPIRISARQIWAQRIFPCDQPPLTKIPAVVEPEKSSAAGGIQWLPKVNRNVRGRILESAGSRFVTGFGVHGRSQLTFPVPICAQSFQCSFGLDRLARDGGCVEAEVILENDDENSNAPIRHTFGPIVGSNDILAIGPVPLASVSAESGKLTLAVDPAPDHPPKFADPLNIRDFANWLTPVVMLDRQQLVAELRSERHVFAWSGWATTIVEGGDLQWKNTPPNAAEEQDSFRLMVKARNQPLILRRELNPSNNNRWLTLLAAAPKSAEMAAQVEVRVNGKRVAGTNDERVERNLTTETRETRPLSVELPDDAREIEIVQQPGVPVIWTAIRISKRLVAVFPLLDEPHRNDSLPFRQVPSQDAATDDQLIVTEAYRGRSSIQVVGGSAAQRTFSSRLQIVRNPGWGQYRYLRFAFRKSGAGRVCLELNHDGEREQPIRYDAGTGDPCAGQAKRVWDEALPDQWIVITRDLYADFGEFDITGVTLRVPDGEHAWFDHVFLARSPVHFASADRQDDPLTARPER